jgi:hypothetical protein
MKRLSFLFVLVVFLVGCAPVETNQPQTQTMSTAEAPVSVESQSSAVVVPAGQSGGERKVKIIGGDEESLREFVQRWLTPAYPGAPGGETQVWMGAFPEELPVDLPLPDGARIVASVQEPEAYTQVILDADMTSSEVTDYYSRTLSAAGWQPAPQEQQGGGFVGAEDSRLRYCLGGEKAYLEVWSLETPGSPTDVRLNLYPPANASLCRDGAQGSTDAGMRLIPSLVAPPGTRITGGSSGSSGDGSANVSTDFESSLTVEELLAHYNTQLEEARWQMVDQGAAQVVAWSTWELTDENGAEWGGTLFVLKGHLTETRRFAMFSVERAP